MDETLYIEFVGGEDRVRMLRPVFERLKQIKQREAVANGMVSDRDQHVDNPAWLDLLDEKAIEWLTADENPWDLESMIDQILGGEYDFVELRYHTGTGRLIYYPYAFPFGGTSPIKALVETFGLKVIRDDLHDGYREWRRERWWRFWEWMS